MRLALRFWSRLLSLVGFRPLNRRHRRRSLARRRRAFARRRSVVRRQRFDTLEKRVVMNADPPTAQNLNLSSVTEDVSYDFGFPASDPEGDSLTFTVTQAPTHGTVSWTGTSYTYTPELNYNGPDSFKFKANDGTWDSNDATVSVTIGAVNDAPTATIPATSYETTEQVPLSLQGLGISVGDVDAGSNVIQVVLSVTDGTLVASGGWSGLSPSTPEGTSITFSGTVAQFNELFTGGSGTSLSFIHRSDTPPTSVTLTLEVNDLGNSGSGGALTASDTAVIYIAAVNDEPTASDVALDLAEDAVASGSLSASDVDGGSLAFSVFGSPTGGTLDLNASGAYTFTPTPNFSGTASFTFRATDLAGAFVQKSLTINYIAVNDAPTVGSSPLTVTVNEDGSIDFDAGVADVDGDALTFTLQSQPGSGTLTRTGSVFTYSPTADFNGTDGFSFYVSDSSGLSSAPQTVAITVAPTNDAPTASDITVEAAEDFVIGGSLSANDIDGDTLTYSLVGSATGGTANVSTSGAYTFTPAANFVGAASFTFRAMDSSGADVIKSVTINYSAVNDPPTVSDTPLPASTGEDSAVEIDLTADDIDGDGLTYIVNTGPAHGTLTQNGARITYTPEANYNGSDSFTYYVRDTSYSTSAIRTVNIGIAAVNDAPIGTPFSLSLDEEGLGYFSPSFSDAEGDSLTFGFSSPYVHFDSATFNYYYAPPANFNGTDTVWMTASDGVATSEQVAITFTVNAVNDPPTIEPSTAAGNLDGTAGWTFTPSSLVTASDVDDASLSYSASNPSNGTLVDNGNGTYTFTPSGVGAASFQITATDSQWATATSTVNFSVLYNAPPIAGNATYTVILPYGTWYTYLDPSHYPATGDYDPEEGTDLLFAWDGGSSGGPTGIIYGNTSGSYGYTLDDRHGNQTHGYVTVNVVVDDPPSVTDDYHYVTIPFGSYILTGSYLPDISNDVSPGDPVTLSWTDNTNTYFYGTPNWSGGGYSSGTFSYQYGITDSHGSTATGYVHIVVTVDQLPIAANDALETNEDTPLIISAATLLANDSDLEGSVSIGGPIYGLSDNGNGTYTYYPGWNFNGSDSFTYTIVDSYGQTATATVNLTVHPVNDAPFAANRFYAAEQNEPRTYSGWDYSLLSSSYAYDYIDSMSVSLVVPSSPITTSGGGTVVLSADGSFAYTPVWNFVGNDTFDYTITDGDGGYTTATVTLQVAANIPPEPRDDGFAVAEDTAITFTRSQLLANDFDGDYDSLAVIAIYGFPAHGTISWHSNGDFTYTPDDGFVGLDKFDYAVADETTTGFATIWISVGPILGLASTGATTLTTQEDTSLALKVAGDRTGGNGEIYYRMYGGYGTLSRNGTPFGYSTPLSNANAVAGFTFTPAANLYGTAQIYVETGVLNTDGSFRSLLTQIVEVAVTPVNDLPTLTTNSGTTIYEGQSTWIYPEYLSIADVDNATTDRTFKITQAPAHGYVALNGVALALNGTFTQDDLANYRVRYVNDGSETTADSFKFTFTDLSGTPSSEYTFAISITLTNDAPTVVIPSSAYTATEQVPLALHGTGLAIGDSDAGNATVQATLSVGSLSSLVVTAGSTGVVVSGTSTTVLLTGTIAQINQLLAGEDGATIFYTFTSNNVGTAPLYLSLSVNDLGNSGYWASAQSTTGYATINLAAVNDAPTATIIPTSYTVVEQATLTLKGTGLSIADPDSTATTLPMQAVVSVLYGTINATAGNSGATVLNSGTNSVTITGTRGQIASLLGSGGTSTLTYVFATDAPPATDTLTLTANDLGNIGGGALTGSDTAVINITRINDAPIAVIEPTTYAATEQTTLALHGTGISVADDSGDADIQVGFTVTAGVLTAAAGTTGVTITNSGTTSITFVGTVAAINQLLAGNDGATFGFFHSSNTPPANATLTLNVSDLGNTGSGGTLTASDTAVINIAAVNDAPTITLPPENYSATEQVSRALEGTGLSIGDVDVASSVVEATISVGAGALSAIVGDSGATVLSAAATSITLSGTIAQINAFLAGAGGATLTFLYAGDMPPASAALTLSVNDLGNAGSGGAQTTIRSIDIEIEGVNDAPTAAIAPAAFAATEGVPTLIEGLSIADADAGAYPILVEISVLYGTLTVSNEVDIVVSGAGTNSVSLSGTLAAINAFLAGTAGASLSYFIGISESHATDTLTLSVSDLGHSSSSPGVPAIDSATAPIEITAGDETPQLQVPAGATAYTAEDYTFLATDEDSILISDDTTGDVEVTVSAEFGTVTLNPQHLSGVTLITGDGSLDDVVVFRGTQGAVNAVLDGLKYRSLIGYWGTDTLTIVVDDLGTSGEDGDRIASGAISIEVKQFHDPVTGDDTFDIVEDERLERSPLAGLLANDNAVDGRVTTIVARPEHGDLTLNSDGSFVYVPNADYHGSDSFIYRTTDVYGVYDEATVTISISSVNDAPRIDSELAAATSIDTPLTFGTLRNNAIVFADDSSPELTVSISVEHGVLELASLEGLTVDPDTDGTSSITMHGTIAALNAAFEGLRYTPDEGYDGDDELTIEATDGDDETTLEIAIEVLPKLTISDRAVDEEAGTVTLTLTLQDTGRTVTLDWELVDLSAIRGSDYTAGAYSGTLTFNPHELSKTITVAILADSIREATESLLLAVSNLEGAIADNTNAIVAIADTSANNPPTATDRTYDFDEDQGKVIGKVAGVLAGAADADDDWLSAVLVDGPAHGVLQLRSDGSFEYTPGRDYHGVDTFSYKVFDGESYSLVRTATINIASVDDVPQAYGDFYSSDMNEDVVGNVATNDFNADNLEVQVVLVAGPEHGRLTLSLDGSFTYRPAPNFEGADRFTYQLTSSAGTSTGEVLIEVGALMNDLNFYNSFVMQLQDYWTDDYGHLPDNARPGFKLTRDSIDGVSFDAVRIVDLIGYGFSYYTDLSEGDVIDVDQFLSRPESLNGYMIDEGYGMYSMTLQAVKRVPSTSGSGFDYVNVGEQITSRLNWLNAPRFDDADGYPLYEHAATAENTDLSGLTIRPAGTNSTTPPIRLKDVQHGRLFYSDGTEILDEADLDSFAARGLIFRPDADFVGTASITVVGLRDLDYDGDLEEENSTTLSILVFAAAAAEPIRALPYSFDTTEDEVLQVLVVDGLAADTGGSVSLVHGVEHGTLVLRADGSFDYTPTADFFGTDRFTYRLTVGAVESLAVVTIDVAGVNDAPSFRAGGDVTVDTAAGSVERKNWATNIKTGRATEIGQTVQFEIVANNHAELFAADGHPAISADGTLTFKLATGAQPTEATIQVRIKDSGGTAHGGVDTGELVTFKIKATAPSNGNDDPRDDGPFVPVGVPVPTVGAKIKVPGEQKVKQGEWKEITGISIDSNVRELLEEEETQVEVTIGVSEGKIKTAQYSKDSAITITGTLDEIEDALQGLQYRAAKDYTGYAVLTIQVKFLDPPYGIKLPGMNASVMLNVRAKIDPTKYAITFQVEGDEDYHGEGAHGKIVGQVTYSGSRVNLDEDPFDGLSVELTSEESEGPSGTLELDDEGKFEHDFEDYDDDDPTGTNGDDFHLKFTVEGIEPPKPEEDADEEEEPESEWEKPSVEGILHLANFAPYVKPRNDGTPWLPPPPAPPAPPVLPPPPSQPDYATTNPNGYDFTIVCGDSSSYIPPDYAWPYLGYYTESNKPDLDSILRSVHFEDRGPDEVTEDEEPVITSYPAFTINTPSGITYQVIYYSGSISARDDDDAEGTFTLSYYAIQEYGSYWNDFYYSNYHLADVKILEKVDNQESHPDRYETDPQLTGTFGRTTTVDDEGVPKDVNVLENDDEKGYDPVVGTERSYYREAYKVMVYPRSNGWGWDPPYETVMWFIKEDTEETEDEITIKVEEQHEETYDLSSSGELTFNAEAIKNGAVVPTVISFTIYGEVASEDPYGSPRRINFTTGGTVLVTDVSRDVHVDIRDNLLVEPAEESPANPPAPGESTPATPTDSLPDSDQAVIRFTRMLSGGSDQLNEEERAFAVSEVKVRYRLEAVDDSGEESEEHESSDDVGPDGSAGDIYTATIPAGKMFVDVVIKAIADDKRERDEKVRVVLISVDNRKVNVADRGKSEEESDGIVVGELTVIDRQDPYVFGTNNVDTSSTGMTREQVLVGDKLVDLFDGRQTWQSPFFGEYVADYQYGYATQTYVVYKPNPESGAQPPESERRIAATGDSWSAGQTADHGTIVRNKVGMGDVSALMVPNPNPTASNAGGGFFGYVDTLSAVSQLNRANDGTTFNGFMLMRRDGTSAWFGGKPGGAGISLPGEDVTEDEAGQPPEKVRTYEYIFEDQELVPGAYYYIEYLEDGVVVPSRATGLYQADSEGKIELPNWTYDRTYLPDVHGKPSYKLYKDFTFETPDGTYGNLTSNTGAEYRFQLKLDNGQIYRFDDTGLLREEEDRFGNKTKYDYDRGPNEDKDARLKSITLQGGAEIKFEYEADDPAHWTTALEKIVIPGDRDIIFSKGEMFSPMPQEEGTDGASSQMRVKIGGSLMQVGVDAAQQAAIKDAVVKTFLSQLSYTEGSASRPSKAPTGEIGRLALPSDKSQPVATYQREKYTSDYSNLGTWKYQFDRFGLVTAKAAPYVSGVAQEDVWQWERDVRTGLVLKEKTPAGRGAKVGTYPAVAADGFDTTVYEYFQDASKQNLNLPKLKSAKYADGTQESWTYGANNQVATHTDRNKNTWTNALKPDGSISSSTDPLKNAIEFVYTVSTGSIGGLAAGLLQSTTTPAANAAGGKVTTVYDYHESGILAGLVKTIKHGDGPTEEFQYDDFGYLKAHRDTDGVWHRYVNDRLGQVLEEYVGPEASKLLVAKYTYDAAGNQISMTTKGASDDEEDSRTTIYGYDAWNRLETVTAPTVSVEGASADSTITYQYTADGLIEHIWDPINRETVYEYNERRELVRTKKTVDGLVYRNGSEMSGLQTTEEREYDVAGNLRVLKNSMMYGQNISYSYDQNGQVVSEQRPATDNNPAMVLKYAYDGLGNLVKQTSADPSGPGTVDTVYKYDKAGRLVRIDKPMGFFTAYSYYGDDSIRTEANGFNSLTYSTTTYEYDSLGKVKHTKVQAAAADTAEESVNRVAEGSGRKEEYVNAGNAKTTYFYDEFGRLKKVTTPDPTGDLPAIETEYEYFLDGSMKSETITAGIEDRSTTYEYDERGRRKSVTADGIETKYEYDEVDRVVKVEVSGGPTQAFDYDSFDNVKHSTTTDDTGKLSEVVAKYDATGMVVSRKTDDFATVRYEYDALNRLVSQETDYEKDGAQPLAKQQTVYNDAGLVRSSFDGVSWTKYTYDSAGRLISSVIRVNGKDETTKTEYSDAARTRTVTDSISNATLYTSDGLGRVVKEKLVGLEGERQYFYNALGQLISTVDRNGRRVNYTYDELQRLTREYWAFDNYSANYTYDELGNLKEASDDNSQYTYTYDPNGRIDTVEFKNKVAPTALGTFQFSYGYDLMNRVNATTIKRSGAEQLVITSDQDGIGRLKNLTSSGGAELAVAYTYDDVATPRKVTSVRSEAGETRFTLVDHRTGGMTKLNYTGSNLVYVVEKVFNQFNQVSSLFRNGQSQYSADFTYDSRGQLIRSTVNGTITFEKDFDAAGNTSSSDGRIALDPHNRLKSLWTKHTEPGGITSEAGYEYQYDNEGNRIFERRFYAPITLDDQANEDAYDFDGDGWSNWKPTLSQFGPVQYTNEEGDNDETAEISLFYDSDVTLSESRTYRIFVNMPAIEKNGEPLALTTDALYKLTYVRNGQRENLEVHLNQRDSGNYVAAGKIWRKAFDVTLEAGVDLDSVAVIVSNNAASTGVLVVDGVRVERLGSEIAYKYDFRNRLIEARETAARIDLQTPGRLINLVTYTYDVFDRRIGTTTFQSIPNESGGYAETTTHDYYVFDDDNRVLTYRSVGSAAPTLIERRLYSGLDQLVAVQQEGKVFWAITDDQGTLLGLYGKTSSDLHGMVQAFDYNPDGSISDRAEDNLVLVGPEYAPHVDVGFQGRERDPVTGLVDFRSRFYDPRSGTFVSEDGIGIADDMNRYRLNRNNSVNNTDPSGHIVIVSGLIGAGLGALWGGFSAYMDGGDWSDILAGAGKGALVGGIMGLTGGAASAAATAMFGGAAMTSAIGVTGAQIAGNVVGSAAGDAIGQGINIAMGNQESFSWGQLTGAAVTGAVLGPLSVGAGRLASASTVAKGALRPAFMAGGGALSAAGGNLIEQGFKNLTGEQRGINWSEVGSSATMGGLGGLAGNMAGLFDKTCFVAGTPLLWEHGHKAIEEFQVGERVWARNEEDPEGPLELKAIEEVFIRRGIVVELTLGGKVIGTTAEHPFFVQGQGWKPAGELQAGDLLATGDGRWMPVEGCYNTGRLETVYNFRVADFHTYFVQGDDWTFAVWAHNASFERYVSKVEADAFKAAGNNFTGKPGHPDNPVRLGPVGTIDRNRLARTAAKRQKYYDHKITVDIPDDVVAKLKKLGVKEALGHANSLAVPQGEPLKVLNAGKKNPVVKKIK